MTPSEQVAAVFSELPGLFSKASACLLYTSLIAIFETEDLDRFSRAMVESLDDAAHRRVERLAIATAVLTGIACFVMLIVVSMVAYILYEGLSTPVSYTHLDVYKRQVTSSRPSTSVTLTPPPPMR